MPKKPAPADNSIMRVGSVLAMAGGALTFLFNKWSMIEPVLMSPAGGVFWSLLLFVGGAGGYHYAVHAPMLQRMSDHEQKLESVISESDKKLEALNRRYTETFGKMQNLEGQMAALEGRKVRDIGGQSK